MLITMSDKELCRINVIHSVAETRMRCREGRAPKCCLLVFIDHATGRLMHLRFGETESAFDYMMATREYLEQHGKPLAFYSDKHGIFRVNNGGSTTTGVTQFGRVLSELGIELICANSPQAKGRVERANQTLQDRLICI